MQLAVLEWKRIVKQKWLWVCFALFLALGLWVSQLTLRQEYESRYCSVDEYLSVSRQYQGMALSDAYRLLEERVEAAGQVRAINSYYQMGLISYEEAAAGLAEYGYADAEPGQIPESELSASLSGGGMVLEEMSMLLKYPEYLETLKQGESGLASLSLFSQDTYVDRIRQKAMKDYAGLQSSVDIWYHNVSAREFLQNRIMDAFIFCFLMAVAALLYTEEHEKGYDMLTGTAGKGKRYFYFAKSAALFGCTGMVVIVYEASLLLFYVIRMGAPTFCAPIQSVAAFEAGQFGLCIWQVMLLTVLLKAAVMFILLQLLSIVACLSGKSSYLLGISAAMAFGFVLLNRYGNVNGQGGFLTYLNPVDLCHTSGMFTEYRNAVLFQTPVSAQCVQGVFLIVLLLGSLLAGGMLYGRPARGSRRRFMRRKRSAPAREKARPLVSCFAVQEMKKLLCSYSLWIPVLLAVICFLFCYGSAPEISLTRQERQYQEYMLQLNGPLTPEKEEFLAGERERFSQLEALREQVLLAENSGLLLQYIEGLLVQKEAFDLVEERYAEIQQRGDDAVFLYETGYLYLFGKLDDTRTNVGIFAGILLLCLLNPYFVWIEMKNNAVDLVRTTANGRGRLLIRQYFCYAVMTALSFSGIYAGNLLTVFRQFGSYGLTQSMDNIPALSDTMQGDCVLSGLLWIAFFRLIGILLCTLCAMAIMYLCRDYLKGALLCGVCFLFPYVLYISGFQFMDGYFLNAFLQGGSLYLFIQEGRFDKIVLILLQTLALSVLAIRVLRREAGGNGAVSSGRHVRLWAE